MPHSRFVFFHHQHLPQLIRSHQQASFLYNCTPKHPGIRSSDVSLDTPLTCQTLDFGPEPVSSERWVLSAREILTLIERIHTPEGATVILLRCCTVVVLDGSPSKTDSSWRSSSPLPIGLPSLGFSGCRGIRWT